MYGYERFTHRKAQKSDLTFNDDTNVSGPFFLVFDFVGSAQSFGSAWSFCFFIPATTANELQLQRISNSDFNFIHYYFLSCLNS